jgi:hypothetical protein
MSDCGPSIGFRRRSARTATHFVKTAKNAKPGAWIETAVQITTSYTRGPLRRKSVYTRVDRSLFGAVAIAVFPPGSHRQLYPQSHLTTIFGANWYRNLLLSLVTLFFNSNLGRPRVIGNCSLSSFPCNTVLLGIRFLYVRIASAYFSHLNVPNSVANRRSNIPVDVCNKHRVTSTPDYYMVYWESIRGCNVSELLFGLFPYI